MSTFPYDVPGIPPCFETRDLECLERLLADLRTYAAGQGPSSDDLEAAPLVDAWITVPDRTSIPIGGMVSSHPILPDRAAVTSRVFAMDHERRWIRTYSRLWRLGAPRPPSSRRS
ncbi:DUF6634 family protein [Aureimonas psammosilenae]|uniref:DUF6634 family protein n=1 Tax=Aureimonas psammosilenae TaxID=2495496 RepID=UPI0012609F7F|nr:DUF6634 family protein [Aureimonas psammosilenae]